MRTETFVLRWAIRVAGTLALVGIPAVALAGWTSWVSDEDGFGAVCPSGSGQAAIGFRCAGAYCDSVSINCANAAYGITFTYPQWTDYFPEEPAQGPWTNLRFCSTPSGGLGVITGIRCSGAYCDNVSLECSRPVKFNSQGAAVPVTTANCTWTEWISEEAPSSATWFKFITAAECRGDYCDDMRFYACDLVPPS